MRCCTGCTRRDKDNLVVPCIACLHYSTLLSNPASAISAARSNALALFFVSIHSLMGTESATIPHPPAHVTCRL